MKRLIACGLLAGLTAAAPAAAETIVYDGGGPNHANAYFADTSYVFTNDAESFTLLPGATTITDAHWWGMCATLTCPAGDFTLSFYADNGGSIGTLIQSYDVGTANQAATGGSIASFYPEYSYSALFAPLTLSANTTYWFGVSNSTAGAQWAMETTGDPNGGFHWQYETGTGWTQQPEDLAFNLTADAVATPEPITLSLLGLGLAGAALRHRRAASRANR